MSARSGGIRGWQRLFERLSSCGVLYHFAFVQDNGMGWRSDHGRRNRDGLLIVGQF